MVKVDGLVATKAATQVSVDRPVLLEQPDHRWVSRGALKLLGVLDPFGVTPEGLICADLGASTGGFTEVLLDRGAARVYAIDVGTKLLHYRLRDHPRIVNMEGVNARHLESLPEPIDLLVGDLSFISLTLILPTVTRLLGANGEAVVLVKPQFEAGRSEIGRGGRIRSESARSEAINGVLEACEAYGLSVKASMDSPLAGAKAGNVEHFVHLCLSGV